VFSKVAFIAVDCRLKRLASTQAINPHTISNPHAGNVRRGQKANRAGWSWGCVSAIDSNEKIIFVVDAHRGDEKRFVVRADEKLTARLFWNLIWRSGKLDFDCKHEEKKCFCRSKRENTVLL